jgi:hypothetical protein
MPTKREMVAAAQEKYARDEGEIEVDDKAKISRAPGNPDGGAYVSAWVWVTDEDAEILANKLDAIFNLPIREDNAR